jgi:hypothetical protein
MAPFSYSTTLRGSRDFPVEIKSEDEGEQPATVLSEHTITSSLVHRERKRHEKHRAESQPPKQPRICSLQGSGATGKVLSSRHQSQSSNLPISGNKPVVSSPKAKKTKIKKEPNDNYYRNRQQNET